LLQEWRSKEEEINKIHASYAGDTHDTNIGKAVKWRFQAGVKHALRLPYPKLALSELNSDGFSALLKFKPGSIVYITLNCECRKIHTGKGF